MLKYIRDFDDVLTRENEYGHFTSSAFILNRERTKILMIFHKIYNSWAWVPINDILKVTSETWIRDRVYAKILIKMRKDGII